MGGRGIVGIASTDDSDFLYTSESERIGGYKVVYFKADPHKGLPLYSHTPSNIYFHRSDNKGYISQMRIYDSKGRAHIDIDWGHTHDKIGKGVAHIQKWHINKNGDPERSKDATLLSRYYIKKYGDLIKKAYPDIKFK